jgi:hypothetical protein
MEHTYGVALLIDPNTKLDLAEDRGELKLEDITYYQAVVGSLMYAALATWPDISYGDGRCSSLIHFAAIH